MALARYEGTTVDDSGNVIPGASIEVRREDNLTALALLYSDRAGTVPEANGLAFVSDSEGAFAFHALGGAYRIRMYKTIGGVPFEKIKRYQAVGTSAETDFDQGLSGGMLFTFDSGTTDGDPGVGHLRFNHATPAAAAFIYIDLLNIYGDDVTSWLESLDDGGGASDRGRLRIQADGSPAVWVEFKISGAVVAASGYRKIPVVHVASAGAFVDEDAVAAFLSSGGAVNASDIAYAGGTGISATNVEGAIDELATEKVDKTQIDIDPFLAADSDTLVASQKATKAYVALFVAAQDVMVFKGVIDCSANPNYPAADKGWTYRVSVGGKIGGGTGPNVQAGDILLCLVDSSAAGNHATVGANWSLIQVNIDGALTTADLGVTVQAYSALLTSIAGVTPTKGRILVGDGSTFSPLGVGTNDHIIKADSSQSLGIRWAPESGGGGGSVLSIRPEDYGALGDLVSVTATVSITSGAAVLTATGAAFVVGDVGKYICVPGAGSAGGKLATTILSYTSGTQVTLAANASTTVTTTSKVVVYGSDDTVALQDTLNAMAAAAPGMSIEFNPGSKYGYTNLTLPNPTNDWRRAIGFSQGISTLQRLVGGTTAYGLASSRWFTGAANGTLANSPIDFHNIIFEGDRNCDNILVDKSYGAEYHGCRFDNAIKNGRLFTRKNQDNSLGTTGYLSNSKMIRCDGIGNGEYWLRTQGTNSDDTDAPTDGQINNCGPDCGNGMGSIYLANASGWSGDSFHTYAIGTAASVGELVIAKMGSFGGLNNCAVEGLTVIGDCGQYSAADIGAGNRFWGGIRVDFAANTNQETFVARGNVLLRTVGGVDAQIIHNNNRSQKTIVADNVSLSATPYANGVGVTAGKWQIGNLIAGANSTDTAMKLAFNLAMDILTLRDASFRVTSSSSSYLEVFRGASGTNNIFAAVDAARSYFGSFANFPLWLQQNSITRAIFTSAAEMQLSASLGRVYAVKTANFTVADGESWIVNNKTGSSCTATLPAAASYPGREIMVKNTQAFTLISASSNVVPKTGGAAGTGILPATSGAWAILVSNGTNWEIMLSGT